MAVKLIAENIVTAEKFLSATEQAGPYIGQPEPDDANTGLSRLLAKGNIADFTYNGTCTGEVPDTTSVIDSVLAAYGDDYFIGGTVTFTSGDNNGETRAVTDFAQATGDLTCAAFPNAVNIGDDFTLTVAIASRDIRVELVGSGDAGDATFKWSHDGTTYFGRDDPNQANWLGETEITNNADRAWRGPIAQASDGELVVLYGSNTDTKTYSIKSNDGGKGLSWDTPVEVHSSASYYPNFLIRLSSGRLYGYLNSKGFCYSDDDAASWTIVDYTTYNFHDAIQLANGNIFAVQGTNGVYCHTSTDGDGGGSWSTATAVEDGANTPAHGTVVQLANGNIVCAYSRGPVPPIEIFCKISTNGGATWGSEIDVMTTAVSVYRYPRLVKDANEDLYCVAKNEAGDDSIHMTTSTDKGATWNDASALVIKTVAGVNLSYPDIILTTHGEFICTYLDDTNDDIDCVRRGMWEAYSGNACPCAIEALEQKLICNIDIMWHGGAGIIGDKWSFAAEYDYAMSKIIEDSPLEPWRSTQDNIASSIVIDMGANERFFADGVAFFGCKQRDLKFQMNDTNSWGSPSVDESISFDVATGAVDAVAGNAIKDTSLLANYKDHELKGMYLRMTSGTDNGVTWKILDNAGDYIFLDTTAANNISASDTFVIFQDHVAKTFTGGLHRFINHAISAQHTADDHYQIGMAVMGKAITLSREFSVGYGVDRRYDIEMLRPPKGGMIPVKGADPKNMFTLTWRAAKDARKELLALLDYVQGKNIVLIPDDSDMLACYLVKHIGNVRQQHRFLDRSDLVGLVFEEV